MDSKLIEFPRDLFKEVRRIAARESFPLALAILDRYDNDTQSIAVNQEEAQHLVDVVGYEATRVSLKCPYTDEHPDYDDELAEEWDEVCQSIHPHTVNCFKQHFEIDE
ncbi:hypothetical protein HCH_07007 [Hahella chejuensis KCTC 2396]|uniref:Uncharacterized protein n=1 Tax=Hahella chejuensis (strain KCTC 2396) TaxID=349521 RepID=Q2S6V2_HAHCH|nr:hypothetical protein [Hahella chejuensis]ABC33622.1 hypothetical protein HCH_07007 [Hahella chejuensis KCTC 2396]